MMKYFCLTIFVFFFSIFMPAGSALHSQEKMITPLEQKSFRDLTRYSEMMEYLEKLDSRSEIFGQKIIGKSVEGREIPALFFSLDEQFGSQRNRKPVVLIFCQQHGDEPSGKEAALLLARDLTGPKKDLLKNLDLILVPQVNPDGGEKDQRRNANEMDLNRNHMVLSEPETRALHELFIEWMPQVTLDVHEYGAISETWISHGFIKNADVQVGKISNLNISPVIYEFSEALFIAGIEKQMTAKGYTFHEYLVGTPFEGSRLRYSTTAINDGRQSFGIYNTFSFIQEGIQYGNLTDKLEHRSKTQLSALTAFLEIINQYASTILQTVNDVRDERMSEIYIRSNPIYVQMDYYSDPVDTSTIFPVFDLKNWQAEDRKLENFHSRVRVRKSITRPVAYIIPASEKEIIEILSRHRIEMNPLTDQRTIPVEAYQIKHVTTMIEEELEVPYVDLEARKISREFEAGTMVIYLTQPAGTFIPLLLEPQSRFSLFQEGSGRKYKMSDYLKEDTEFPIYRLMEDVQLHQIKGKFN